MSSPRSIKPLLIALALVLASCVSGQEPRYAPRPAKAGQLPQEIAPSREGAVENQQDQRAPNFSQHPYAIVCAVPGAPPHRILIPDGRNPTDFCPASRTTDRIYQQDSDVTYLPKYSGIPPPANWLSLQTQQDNIAKDELRALKLRNKTPGQQTPEQETSGQQPP